jgi:hypothetical protein
VIRVIGPLPINCRLRHRVLFRIEPIFDMYPVPVGLHTYTGAAALGVLIACVGKISLNNNHYISELGIFDRWKIGFACKIHFFRAKHK